MINRITSEPITQLSENSIAVFGSNLAGRHGKGFAKYCLDNFGAIYGQGIGLQGNSYAIPTKDGNMNVLSLKQIEPYVKTFIEYAQNHPELIFKVSSVGCGLAGYTPSEIAQLFKGSIELKNIHLSVEFWDVLNSEI